MHAHRLQDRISHGLGRASRHIGELFDAYRPAGAADPLQAHNRYLRLHAVFADENETFRRPRGYGRAAWSGIFDTGYTRPGDYLAGPSGIFFIAAQQSLLPALCIETTHTITISRPGAPDLPGVNGYGGLLAATSTPVLTNWPASILFAGAGSPGDLPGDASIPTWTVLLPPTPAALQPADMIADDNGTSYVIGSAELTGLGWRILAKQAAT